jgi:hypothetical protein
MSISKVQAEALAEGFLDNLGSSKDELQPRSSLTEIILLAGELIEDAQDNLVAGNNIASGALSESLVADNPQVIGKKFTIDILMNFYGRFLNKGVKGTRSGHSSAGYSFKNEFPSKKMVSAFVAYLKRAKVSTRTVKKNKGYGKHELKNKTLPEVQHAYALARTVKMLGIKKRGFLDKAISSTRRKVSDRMGKALSIDVINSIPKKI